MVQPLATCESWRRPVSVSSQGYGWLERLRIGAKAETSLHSDSEAMIIALARMQGANASARGSTFALHLCTGG